VKILVAEDDPVTQHLLKATLEKWGHEPVLCQNGEEAWALLQEEGAPQLAILDWMMPKMEGLDVCRLIRQHAKTLHVYVILLTAKNRTDDLVEGLEAGADDYMIKPFNKEELRVRLKTGERILGLQAQALANEQARVMMETAGAAAHEINQPLSVIVGMAELWTRLLDRKNELYLDAVHVLDAAQNIADIIKKMQQARAYVTTDYVENKKIIDFNAAGQTQLDFVRDDVDRQT